MQTWVLVILISIGTWGHTVALTPGQRPVRVVDYPNEHACYKALRLMKLTGKQQISDGTAHSIAYCQPKGE